MCGLDIYDGEGLLILQHDGCGYDITCGSLDYIGAIWFYLQSSFMGKRAKYFLFPK